MMSLIDRDIMGLSSIIPDMHPNIINDALSLVGGFSDKPDELPESVFDQQLRDLIKLVPVE